MNDVSAVAATYVENHATLGKRMPLGIPDGPSFEVLKIRGWLRGKRQVLRGRIFFIPERFAHRM
jgi:hypothetical protein